MWLGYGWPITPFRTVAHVRLNKIKTNWKRSPSTPCGFVLSQQCNKTTTKQNKTKSVVCFTAVLPQYMRTPAIKYKFSALIRIQTHHTNEIHLGSQTDCIALFKCTCCSQVTRVEYTLRDRQTDNRARAGREIQVSYVSQHQFIIAVEDKVVPNGVSTVSIQVKSKPKTCMRFCLKQSCTGRPTSAQSYLT